jgi:UDP-glucose 4-epimerase
VLLRFFGSYGPNQPLSWWGGPPPVFIDAVLNGKTIPVHGDGQQTRSFTYVSDTVRGIYAATVRKEAEGRVLNIGSCEEVTIVELAKRIQKAAGKPGEPRIELVPYESFTGKKYEDVRRRVPDTTLAKNILDFEAMVSLDDGLKLTIDWQREATRQRRFGG